MKRYKHRVFGSIVMSILAVFVAGCQDPVASDSADGSDSSTVELLLRASSAMEGAEVASASRGGALQNLATADSCESGGYIISGAPEYMTVTLKQISLRYSEPNGYETVWSGSHEVKLEGTAIELDELSEELS